MFTARFWIATAERAVKTFAQSSLALLTGDQLGILNVDWGHVGSVGAMAALASVLFSIVSLGVGPEGSPSVVRQP